MYRSSVNLGFKEPKEIYPDYPMEEAPKLFMISLKEGKFPSMPYTQKSTSRKDGHKIGILKRFGLSHGNTFDVVANTYENTQLLWTVKQFIEVFPVTFPNGEPSADIDPSRILLKQNGECVILEENSELAKDGENYKFMGYRRCTGCIESECENLGMCRKLYWSSMSSPIKREAPHMWKFRKVKETVEMVNDSEKDGKIADGKISDGKVSLIDKYKFSCKSLKL